MKKIRKNKTKVSQSKEIKAASLGNPTVKILISYHKKDGLLKNDILTPVNAGRANAVKSNKADLPWLIENTIGDNTGENISEKNSYYNEMTTLYWAWKNYDKIGNPDYIGHMHYRRHFFFKDGEKSVYELGDINSDYLSSIGYSSERIIKLCTESDLISPKPQWRASAYEHFKRNFDINELDTAVSILKERNPELSAAADAYLSDSKLYFCNIFIMPRELFFEYCNYIFPILEEFENRIDMSEPGKRMYVSEWLTGIFIRRQIDLKKNVKFLPTAVAQADLVIPVVFASDNNYAVQLGVAITSLVENARPTTHYDIRCLVSDDFSEENKEIVNSVIKGQSRHKITFVHVDDSLFDAIQIKTEHLTKGAFYRLLSADILPDLNKIIYLDDDVVVLGDLEILFRYAIDTQYIGGVRAPGFYYPEKWRKDKENELGIKIDQYVNSGVLLMNLKKIREDNMQEKFIELAQNSYRSEDQDTLNVACYGRIRHIPFRFNCQTKYTSPDSPEKYKYESVIPKDERIDAEKNPVIIHFANRIKPWQDNTCYLAEKWWEYYSLFKEKTCIVDTAITNESGKPKIVVSVLPNQEIIKSDCIINLYEGDKKRLQESELKWISQNCIDGTLGESVINRKEFNAISSIYWIWKNYDRIGNPSYIGICKRGLFFNFNQNADRSIVIDGYENADKKLNINAEALEKLCEQYDLIVPYPLHRETIYSHFASQNNKELLDKAIETINELYPEYSETANEYVHGSEGYFNNLFIFKKDLFFEYCEWLFSILFKYLNKVQEKNEISVRERLTGIFILHQIKKGRKCYHSGTALIEGKHVIPVVYSTDNIQVDNLCVSITSLLKNAQNTTLYDLTILISNEFNNEYRKKICDTVSNLDKRHSIHFVNIGAKFCNSYSNINKQIKSQYYKLLLLSTLSLKCKKFIVLSPETVVLKDLTKLFRIDTNYAVNGVISHFVKEFDSSKKIQYCKRVGLKDFDSYIDSKVLVVNTEKLKAFDIKNLLRLSRNGNPNTDSDILNYICGNNIGKIDERYNVYVDFSKESAIKDSEAFILSFDTGMDIWSYTKNNSNSIWWDYAKESPAELTVQSLYNSKHGDMPYLAGKVKSLSPKLSVIIPVYNMEKYIVECLNSVVTQTLDDIEIICINDGSDDNSLDILNKYAMADKRIIVVNQSNIGVGNSRNVGISLARGKFIAFMDPDDYYPEITTLEHLYEKAVANNADVCGGSFCEVDNKGEIHFNYRQELQDYVFKTEGFVSYKEHQFDYGYIRFIYKTSVIKENNITFPAYSRFQDPPFFVNVMTTVGKFYAIPEFAYVYRLGYKKINWTSTKINDLMSGLIDNLQISKKYQLEKLHYLTYKHIVKDNYENIYNNLINGDKKLYEKLIQANELIDKDLISKATDGNENFSILKPLDDFFLGNKTEAPVQEKVKEIDSETLNEMKNEISELKANNDELLNTILLTRKSVSFRVGRFLTFIPRKIRAKIRHTEF